MNTRWSLSQLEAALTCRADLFDAPHQSAFRIFNGFTEGYPDLAVDLYASTLLIHNYASEAGSGTSVISASLEFLRDRLPWLRAAVVNPRSGKSQAETRGTLLFGDRPDHRISEDGTWYAIDLQMNRDASLYLDTRNLRSWIKQNMNGRAVANFFAYTGSLGIAALAGAASRVVQHDLHRKFLDVAKRSCMLNGYPIREEEFIVGDFFEQVGKFKRAGTSFDCVIIDPPFFSMTSKGRVDQERESRRIINKVRPLIKDGGCLIAINNAVYVSGAEYMQTLESVCADGYVKIGELIPVPDDFTGYPETRLGKPISDPHPFNHATKIAVLEVRRKGSHREAQA